jgi:hypothetical protein
MLWMAVDTSKYELPLAVGGNAKELGQLLGVSESVNLHGKITENGNPHSRGTSTNYGYGKFALNYCPTCGRKLEELKGGD